MKYLLSTGEHFRMESNSTPTKIGRALSISTSGKEESSKAGMRDSPA